jgi:glycosyltransferase involved in cell wall biosynthesis
MRPRVSVCIPSYNYATYLPQTLDSVLGQSYTDFEIIVVDDASKDDSLKIAKSYHRRYPDKVRIFTHPGGANKGVTATCNLAIEKARGEFLAWLGSDDAWYPEKLAIQVNELDLHPRLGMTYSYADIINMEGIKTGEVIGRDVSPAVLPMLIAGNFIPHLTALHRRVCLDKTDNYDETLLYSDWEMWLKVANFFQISFIDQPLAMYRMHGVNMYTGSTNETQTRHSMAVIDKFMHVNFEGPLAEPFIQALLSFRMAAFHFKLGQLKQAEDLLQKCLNIDQRFADQWRFLADWLDLFNDDAKFGLFASAYFPNKSRSKFQSTQFMKAAAYYRSRDINLARDFALKSVQKDFRNIRKRELIGTILQASTHPRFYNFLRSVFKKVST